MVKADLQHISWRRKRLCSFAQGTLTKTVLFLLHDKKNSLWGSVELLENRQKTSFPTLKHYYSLAWLFLQLQLVKSSTLR